MVLLYDYENFIRFLGIDRDQFLQLKATLASADFDTQYLQIIIIMHFCLHSEANKMTYTCKLHYNIMQLGLLGICRYYVQGRLRWQLNIT